MRLRVVTDKNNKWMQLFNADGEVKSVRPATNEEAWMFGEMDSISTENNQLQIRAESAEAEVREALETIKALTLALAEANGDKGINRVF
jgi:hypothetical protein